MKLPKPGKVNLSKPGKVKLPKPGKMPGNLKLPVFHMKSGFLKKNLITLIAAAVLIIGTGTAYGTLATRDADRGFDPIEGVNQDRYQVLVSGEGYKLTKIQERNYKLQKKQNEVNAAQAAQNAQNNPTTIRTSSGSRVYRTSNYRYRYNRSRSSYSTSGTVFIATNIYSQKSTKLNWKAGDEFSFAVTAYTYKNGKKDTLSKDEIKVTSDKGTLKHTKSKDGNQYYTLKLGEGINKITVTAKDKKSKKKSKNTYTITAGKSSGESTKPSSTKPSTTKPSTTNPTTVEKAVDIGFGLTSAKIKITDDTDAYYVLSHTPGITTNGSGEVVEVKGDFSGISLPELEGYDKNYKKDDLMEKCREENQDDIADEKESLKDEIRTIRREKIEKDNPELSDEEIDALVEEGFDDYCDDYYDEHYFDDYYNKWIKEVRLGDTIKTGDDFYGVYQYKWKYNNVKGKKNVTDKTKINLRLTLEKI